MTKGNLELSIKILVAAIVVGVASSSTFYNWNCRTKFFVFLKSENIKARVKSYKTNHVVDLTSLDILRLRTALEEAKRYYPAHESWREICRVSFVGENYSVLFADVGGKVVGRVDIRGDNVFNSKCGYYLNSEFGGLIKKLPPLD